MTFISDVMMSFSRRHSVKVMSDITIRCIFASAHDILKIVFRFQCSKGQGIHSTYYHMRDLHR